MPLPLLLLTGNGTLAGQDRGGVPTATGSGALRYASGPFPTTQAFFVEEGTTNLCTNPSFETGTAGWTAANASLAQSAAWAAPLPWGTNTTAGTRCGALTATGANAEADYAITLTAAAYSLSAWLSQATGGSRTAQMTYNGALVGSPVTVPSGVATRVTAPNITGVASAANAGVRWTNSQAGDVLLLDAVQVEQKAYATSYTDGSLGPGYAWTGTAHASASTRSVASVALASAGRIASPRGSVALWFTRAVDAGAWQDLFSVSATASQDRIFLAIKPTGQLASLMSGNGSQGGASRPAAIPVGEQHFAYMDWDGTDTAVALDNEPRATGARPTPFGAVGPTVQIGALNAGSELLDGPIGPVAVFDRPLTDAERLKLYNLGREWTMGMLQPSFGGVLRAGQPSPLAAGRVAVPSPLAVGRA